jgi:hypothetical protein
MAANRAAFTSAAAGPSDAAACSDHSRLIHRMKPGYPRASRPQERESMRSGSGGAVLAFRPARQVPQ